MKKATIVKEQSSNNHSVEIKELQVKLVDLESQFKEIITENKILKAEVKAVTDFSDDVLSAGNNAITSIDTIVSTYLIVLSISVTIFLALTGLYFNKRRESHLKDATKNFMDKLHSDTTVMDNFMSKLVSHPNIAENITNSIDHASRAIAEQRHQGGKKDMVEVMRKMADSIEKGDHNEH